MPVGWNVNGIEIYFQKGRKSSRNELLPEHSMDKRKPAALRLPDTE
jgi:hypothetical protein